MKRILLSAIIAFLASLPFALSPGLAASSGDGYTAYADGVEAGVGLAEAEAVLAYLQQGDEPALMSATFSPRGGGSPGPELCCLSCAPLSGDDRALCTANCEITYGVSC